MTVNGCVNGSVTLQLLTDELPVLVTAILFNTAPLFQTSALPTLQLMPPVEPDELELLELELLLEDDDELELLLEEELELLLDELELPLPTGG